MNINSFSHPGYLYQLTKNENGIESILKEAQGLREKEQTLYIYLTPLESAIHPFNNCRLKSIMNKVEIVVFDNPPVMDERAFSDLLCVLLQKNYNKEILLRISKALTQSLNDREIDMTLINQKMDHTLEKLAMSVTLKVLIIMANNLGLKQKSSESTHLIHSSERMNPIHCIYQKAKETKKIIEYIDQRSFIDKNKKLLFDNGFLETLLCSFITDQRLVQDLLLNLKIEEESWNMGTLKDTDYSRFKKHPTIVNLQQKLEGMKDGDETFILAEKVNHYFSSKKKTLFVLERNPKVMQELKTFISFLNDSDVRIKGPIKEPTGYFWKIKKEDKTVGYLLGSIHLTPNYLLDLNSCIRKCFEKSNRLAIEIDTTKQDIAKINHVEAKKRLEEKYSSLTHDQMQNIYTMLKKLFPNESKSIKFNDEQEKIEFILHVISDLKSQIYSELELFSGIDLHLIQQAKHHNKPIEDLETHEQYKQQETTVTTVTSDPIQDLFLRILSSEELKQFKDASKVIKFFIEQISLFLSKTLKPMFDAWEEGNLKEFDHSKDDSTNKKIIMTQRNMNMAIKIVNLVKDKEKVFCCVGAAHTAGEMNIQTFLNTFGFVTERVLI